MRFIHALPAVLALCLCIALLTGCRLLLPAAASPWGVRVTAAQASDEWDEFYVDADSETVLVVLSVEYRNQRRTSVQFAPESLVLVHMGAEEIGWGQTPALHKAGDSTLVTDFWEESVLLDVEAGETRTDTFVFEFPRGYTEFALYFPETPRIAVTLQ